MGTKKVPRSQKARNFSQTSFKLLSGESAEAGVGCDRVSEALNTWGRGSVKETEVN